ncbi:hypothetical protein FGD67_16245 [Colwellia sp. M166]|uniref:hypothetical protein n=1 Tax=Colwellia sp. M166 TaxID=2583805 RepID=UPI00211DEBC0|nr:hypothetical protein [Colwellia sp. M166]UUO24604.1 hypothetical protein FGD67_16245 [Colwellia sp. M166]|tara:strand:+ start:54876 stop:55316 length:441 start_codon:yes stop_codon:yes gene_type:complete
MKTIILSLSLVFSLASFIAHAEELKAKKLENVEFLSISYTDFKPGKADRAMEIIRDHYFPASKKAGTQVPYIVQLHSGEWDMITAWKLKDGYSSMEWELTEDGVKWMSAFMKQEGKEKSKEIRDEFNSLIQRSSHVIGYHPTDIKE